MRTRKADPEPPFFAREGGALSPLIILADHARVRVPPAFGDLGLPREAFQRHIAYDPGAEIIASRLAELWDAHLFFTNFTRLLIDPNRGMEDPTLIMRISDGAVIPGNAAVDADERAYRILHYHAPYRQAVETKIQEILAQGLSPIVLSIHSFTPTWKGRPRPWHIGLLHDHDLRLTELMMAAARQAFPDYRVGLNEPYRAGLKGDTMWTHCVERGLAQGLLEVRNDLVRDEAAAIEFTDRFAAHLGLLLETPCLHRPFAEQEKTLVPTNNEDKND